MSEGEQNIRRAILAGSCALLLAGSGSAARGVLIGRLAGLCRQAGNLADGDLAPVVMAASRLTGVVPSPARWDGEGQLRQALARYFAGQSDLLAAVVLRQGGGAHA